MEMLQCRFILSSLLVLNGCFYEASCQTIFTYTSKDAELLPCAIEAETVGVTWSNQVAASQIRVLEYQIGTPPKITISPEEKYRNFDYTMNTTSFNLVIRNVEDEDGGGYICTPLGLDIATFDVTVEVIPGTFSLDCFVPPDVTCPVQGVIPTSELICVCAANGVRPGTLYLDIPDAHTAQQNESIDSGNLFDLRLKATVPVTESITEVTCSVKGYNTNEPIPSELITTTFMISPPTKCSLDIAFDQECKVATLTCSCTASPTDRESPSDKGMVYSYFNGSGHIIEGGTTTPAQTNDVAAGAVNTYSCSGCNGLYYGDSSNVTNSSECTISTTALPTTTIVTTAPLSTNEPTSTKATDATTSTMHTEDSTMVTTTEEPKDDNPKNPESAGLTTGAIVGISLGVVAAVIVIVVVAVIMCKKGEDDSKPSDSSVADGNVTATNVNITSSEPPAPVYGVVKKDSKKKSDKLDDNGAGPRGDPEIPAYGVVDKNRTKDPTPAPRSSMRDSKNPSNPKQDGPLELQYAALDHGNKPPSDEVRKPKEEPTEYATVQSVIV